MGSQVGVGKQRFEAQARCRADLLRQGIEACRQVPFAIGQGVASRHLPRRLDEYPAMVWLVTKNSPGAAEHAPRPGLAQRSAAAGTACRARVRQCSASKCCQPSKR